MKLCEYCDNNHDGSYGSGRFCGQSCSRKFSANNNRIKTNEKISKSLRGIPRPNRRLQRINKMCPICKKEFESLKHQNQTFCGHDCFNFDRRNGFKYSKKPCGGNYSPGCGTGYSGYYKGYWCDSTYELVWIIYNLDHKKNIQRNSKSFPYTFQGNQHNYYPDFVADDTYYEIKGYQTKKDLAKWEQFPHKLIVLFKSDIQYMFDYVDENYTTQYNSLYEVSSKNHLKNNCLFCGEPCKYTYCSLSHAAKHRWQSRQDSNL